MLLSLVITFAQVFRLSCRNRSLFLDGAGPHFFRAVLYSPAPWGTDSDLYYQTEYYKSHWPALFERDLRMIALMGANAVRVHSSFGIANNLGRHTAFLDAAYINGIAVFLSYSIIGSGQGSTSLVGATDQDSALISFRTYLLAAKHAATVLVFVGDRCYHHSNSLEVNRLRHSLSCRASQSWQSEYLRGWLRLQRCVRRFRFRHVRSSAAAKNGPQP